MKYTAPTMQSAQRQSRFVGEMCISIDPFDSLPGAGFEARLVACLQPRRDLEQRLEHERPLVHTRMRDGERWKREHGIPVQQQVEVEGARRIREAARAAMARLDFLQPGEQALGGQARLELRDRVDEVALSGEANRRAAIQG